MSTITQVQSGITGGMVSEVTGFERLVFDDMRIPFEPSRLYRIRARIKNTARPTGSLGNLVRVGMEGIAADGITMVGTDGTPTVSGQYYVAADDHDMTEYDLDEWVEFTGYFRGQGTYVPEATTPAMAGGLNAAVAYVQPVVWVNMPDGDGTVHVGEVLLDVLPEDADQLAESSTKKWASETGATVGGTLGLNLKDPQGNVMSMFTSQYIDIAPTVVAEIPGEVITCIYRRPRTSLLSSEGWFCVLVGTASGKIYRAASTSLEDMANIALVYTLSPAAPIYGIEYNATLDAYFAWTGIGSLTYGRILRAPVVFQVDQGTNWSLYANGPATGMDITAGCFSGSVLVIGTGGSAALGIIYSSTTGSSWTARLTTSGNYVLDIKRNVAGTAWYATVGNGGTDRIYSSTNGTSWATSLSSAGVLTGAPMLAHVDLRQPTTSLMLVPYRDASGHPAIRSYNGTSWSTVAVYPNISGGSAYLLSWNGTLYSFGDGVDSPFLRRVFDTSGNPVWETRIVWTDWDFNGKHVVCNDRVLFLDGTSGKIWMISQFQLLLY